MENKLQLFEHEQFGKVRVVIIDGDPWFVAADVCRILEVKNSRDALSRLDDDEKQSILLPDGTSKNGVTNSVGLNYGINDATFGWIENRVNVVNEPGLYRLIFTSRKLEAKKFQRWIYHEVLPSIRKTGSYSLVAPAAKVPNPNRRAGQFKDACVYVALMSNGTVKIGQSNNVGKRLSNVKSQYKLSVVKEFHTPFMARKAARLIEQVCHEIFSPSKIDGEFFSVKFETACAVIDSFAKFTAKIGDSKFSLISAKSVVGKKFD